MLVDDNVNFLQYVPMHPDRSSPKMSPMTTLFRCTIRWPCHRLTTNTLRRPSPFREKKTLDTSAFIGDDDYYPQQVPTHPEYWAPWSLWRTINASTFVADQLKYLRHALTHSEHSKTRQLWMMILFRCRSGHPRFALKSRLRSAHLT